MLSLFSLFSFCDVLPVLCSPCSLVLSMFPLFSFCDVLLSMFSLFSGVHFVSIEICSPEGSWCSALLILPVLWSLLSGVFPVLWCSPCPLVFSSFSLFSRSGALLVLHFLCLQSEHHMNTMHAENRENVDQIADLQRAGRMRRTWRTLGKRSLRLAQLYLEYKN